jgi:glutathione peroxidase
MNSKSRALTLLLAAGAIFAGASTVFDYVPLAIDDKPAPLAAYRGKVLLIVNVASQSVFAGQYEGLESLYQKYRDQGLVVLAFPSNDFGQQEPDGNDAIRQFATAKYKTNFPLFAKIAVTGDHISPLYQFLTDKPAVADDGAKDKLAEPATGGPVRWSFTKFLIGRDGKVAKRFEPDTEPDDPELVNAIEKALDGKPAPDAVSAKKKP